MVIRVKRAYDPPGPGEGRRFLVDRLWPRGIKKDALKLDGWLKDLAPSSSLRAWFAHDPAKWDEFRRRYHAELNENPPVWQGLKDAAKKGDITLVYGARNTEHNDAVALKEYLEKHP